MKEIDATKTIVLELDFTSEVYNVDVFCEFDADEVILKYVSLYDGSTQINTTIYVFSSPIFDNKPFFTFATILNASRDVIYNEMINTVFTYKQPMKFQGNYPIYLRSVLYDTPIQSGTLLVNACFTITFIKYKK